MAEAEKGGAEEGAEAKEGAEEGAAGWVRAAVHDAVVAQRDAALVQRDEAVAQRDEAVAQRDEAVAQRDEARHALGALAARRDEGEAQLRAEVALQRTQPDQPQPIPST